MTFLEFVVQTVTDVTDWIRDLFSSNTPTTASNSTNNSDKSISHTTSLIEAKSLNNKTIKHEDIKNENKESVNDLSILSRIYGYFKSFFIKSEIRTSEEYKQYISKRKKYTLDTYSDDMCWLIAKRQHEINTLNKFKNSIPTTLENNNKVMKQKLLIENAYFEARTNLQNNGIKDGLKIIKSKKIKD